MTAGEANVKLVSNAMANATRRKIMARLLEGEGISADSLLEIGGSMLDYHLQMLAQAGLIEIGDGSLTLTEFGKNFMAERGEKPSPAKKELAGTPLLQVTEVRQLLPCIADPSKLRIIARLKPVPGGSLKLLEPLFPRARYSEKIGALIIQRGRVLITLYTNGNATLTMIESEEEARDILEGLRKTINDAIQSGVTPAPRERVKVDHTEIYKYLPKTDCKICGEQSCYAFAVRLVAAETTLERCTPLLEPQFASSLETLQALKEYL